MKKRKRLSLIPRSLLTLALLLLLCGLGWAVQGWPRLTRPAAFREAMEENYRPGVPLETWTALASAEVGKPQEILALGYEEGVAYEVRLERNRLSWRPEKFLLLVPFSQTYTSGSESAVLEYPAVEGICVVPLAWDEIYTRQVSPETATPVLAVRADAARIEGELRVEAIPERGTGEEAQPALPGGSCALVPLTQRDGWTFLGFRAEGKPSLGERGLTSLKNGEITPEGRLLAWMMEAVLWGADPMGYPAATQPGTVTVRLYDEADRLLRSVVWSPGN